MDTDTNTAKRNQARRERYAADPEYRAGVIRATRENYRKRRGRAVPRDHCTDSLRELSKIGTWRKRFQTGHKTLTFSFGEMGDAVGRSGQVFRRWVRKGLVPSPVVRTVAGEWVYTLPEARAILKVLARHQREVIYFRADHSETVEAIRLAVEKVRGEV